MIGRSAALLELFSGFADSALLQNGIRYRKTGTWQGTGRSRAA
jgi:hypothetical protein